MEIGPVHNDQPSSGRVEAEKSKINSGPKARPAGDRIDISNEARMKLATLADRALHAETKASGQYGPGAARKTSQQTGAARNAAGAHDDNRAKLARVRGRIESGFYDRPDIKEETARRLAAEFKKSSGENK